MALSNEHERIAIAIGKAMVGYEPKIAIGHNVAIALGYPISDRRYLAFRQAILSAHRLVKAEWSTDASAG